MGVLDELTVSTVHLLAQGTVERIFGPPGTGKSSALRDEIRTLVAQRGPDSTAVTSFTVTAACNLARLATDLPDRNVGTLHSLAYRALGTPDVALHPKIIKDWNTRVGHGWRLSADGRRGQPESIEGAGLGGTDGDELLAAYDVARSQFVPLNAMPATVRQFAQAWEKWMKDAGVIDFTSMIKIALERAIEGERAPGNPEVLISDEAQDMTPLETALVLAWGGLAGHTILALDDDQAINGWRGGDAAPILALGTGMDGGPQLDVEVLDRILGQSYRIPASVQTIAQCWIDQCSDRRDKPYRPRDADGQCYTVGHKIESMATAEQIAKDAHAGRSVAVLASCEYMLHGLIKNLKRLGVPFANPYRPLERRWNPLHSATGMTAAERLYRYLVMDEASLGGWEHQGGRARLWTGDDIRAWLPFVRSDAGLARGAKSADGPARLLPSGECSLAQVEALFSDEAALTQAVEPSLNWFMQAALGSKTDVLTYPAAVARRAGPAALVDPPLVQIGTIHSYKGAEADVVYLSPSVSGAGWAEWQRGGRARDATRRQFYVGLTRAIESCIVLAPSERSVPRQELCPIEMQVR